MCHGYEMRWWRSEDKAKKKVEEANRDAIRTLTAEAEEKAKAPAKDKAGDKELIPAE